MTHVWMFLESGNVRQSACDRNPKAVHASASSKSFH